MKIDTILRVAFFLSFILGTNLLLNFASVYMIKFKFFAKCTSQIGGSLIAKQLTNGNKSKECCLFVTYSQVIHKIFKIPKINDRVNNTKTTDAIFNSFENIKAHLFTSCACSPDTKTSDSNNTDIEGNQVNSGDVNLKEEINKGVKMVDINKKKEDEPKVIYRKDYKPPVFTISDTVLSFDIFPDHTTVKSELSVKRQELSKGADLVLNGVSLEIKAIHINDQQLNEQEHYSYDNEFLTVFSKSLPETDFTFKAEIVIHPEKNFALSGLYKSNALYTTQCEASGFRRITFFLDRPDVMSKYDVTICADKTECPVILSNGDKMQEYDIQNNRRCARYVDPHPKPSYLFALVAGKLAYLEDSYTTKFTSRKVGLFVYSEEQYVSKLKWALETLKKAMAFDEAYFHLEYDLSRLNLVAVSDFNQGAMENKGLNIFNANSLLAEKRTSPDSVYERILTVVSHEYFHNWTGNRITLRDWFQLTLKEGLTVFREQLFSHEEIKSDTFLLDNVNYIRSVQFLEDSSPVAHPIRPESYVSMENFYTTTVYEKGSQVMRMYHIILGEEYYKKGIAFYVKKHDGTGATCEDFNNAMEEAYKLKKGDNNASLQQYMLWFSQSGTPHVSATYSYDANKKEFYITLKQQTFPTHDQPQKEPLFIPVIVGLINPENGKQLVESTTLELTEKEQTFTFKDIPVKPLPSVLRGFSAPVYFEDNLTTEERILLIKYDVDSFVIYNSAVFLHMEQLKKNYNEWLTAKSEGVQNIQDAKLTPVCKDFIEALKYVLEHPNMDAGVQSYLLKLPSDKYIMNNIKEIDTDVLYDVKMFIYKELGKHLNEYFYKLFLDLEKEAEDTTHFNDETHVDFDQINKRKLRSTLLSLLSVNKYPNIMNHIKKYAESQYPSNMLASIVYAGYFDEFEEIFRSTYEIAQQDDLLLNSWLANVSNVNREDIYDIIHNVEQDILKGTKNPNIIRAVYLSFTANTKYFNDKSGKGYKLLADIIIKTDAFNPQVASQLCRPFSIWTKLNKPRQELIVAEINRVLQEPNLSNETKELLLRLTNKL